MLPAAIGWKFYRPFPSPSQMKLLLPQLRILYSGSFEFKPKVSYNRRSAPVKWKHDIESSEFIIYDVPPNEHVNIELFNATKKLTIDQVLVDGQLITEFMNKRALSSACPASGWMRALLLGTYNPYDKYQKRQDYELPYGIPDGYSGCKGYIFYNQP